MDLPDVLEKFEILLTKNTNMGLGEISYFLIWAIGGQFLV
jgi:hypothetical protein